MFMQKFFSIFLLVIALTGCSLTPKAVNLPVANPDSSTIKATPLPPVPSTESGTTQSGKTTPVLTPHDAIVPSKHPVVSASGSQKDDADVAKVMSDLDSIFSEIEGKK